MHGMGPLLGLLLATAACGASGNSPGGGSTNAGSAGSAGSGGTTSGKSVGSEFEGIYTLDTVTINTASCDVEGESASFPDTHLVMKSSERLGSSYLGVQSCLGVASCREVASTLGTATSVTGHLSYAFYPRSGSGLEGTWIYPGRFESGKCIHGGVMDNVLEGTNGVATIEQRGRFVDYPAASEAACSVDAAPEAVASLSCSELRVIDATFAEAL